jgi:hypothetical protein
MSMKNVGPKIAVFALSALCLILVPTGCNPNSIGRPCINANQNAATGVQIASPALECPSRLCLIQQTTDGTQGNSRNTCTASCESDGDCDAETKDYCQAGFRCAVATQVGRFCCRKFCVCQSDLSPGFNIDSDDLANGNIITPHACDPTSDAIITCSNVTK